MKRWSFALPLAAAFAVLALATRRNLSEPHLRLFSDMVRTPAYKSQTLNPIFGDGITQRAPIEGTIARGFEPFAFGREPAERERAGRELKSPYPAPSLDVMLRGKFVFENYCAHCHGLRAAGDGPVTKAFPGFSFPINGKSTFDLPDGTLFHVITYGRNLMPSHASQLSQDDRWKVIVYLRELQRQELARLGPLAIVPEDPRRHGLISTAYGKELFAQNCSACHGAEGRHPQPGIPTLNAPSVLAIASDDYYWDIINHGRPGTQMPSWNGVLTKSQILSIVQYIRSFAPPAPDRAKIALSQGSAERGMALYKTHCIGCHGENGKGGIGNSLSAPSFLALASPQFLQDTITIGRRHTAMPASYDLSPQDVADLIAFIRSWARPLNSVVEFERALPRASKAAGKEIFEARCAGCHGVNGEGGLGSRLNDDQFLSLGNDRFLYRVITEGRPGTAMPSWHFFTSAQVADLVTFIRSWQKSTVVTAGSPHNGRPEFGEVLFKQECVKCHGPHGEGDLGSQIANAAFLSQVSDDFLWKTIAYGKKGTEMKGFLNRARNPLAEEDINHIVAYLRRLQKEPSAEPLAGTYSWASAKDGEKIFKGKGKCWTCHGLDGEGGSGPSLRNPGFLHVATNGFLTATVILGRENTPMKSFYHGGDAELAQEDIENVVTYIRGFEKNPITASRKVERTTERVAHGKVLFAQNCARCHGALGEGKHESHEGGFAPSLNNKEFLKAADDNFLLATIALGRPGTPMKAFAAGIGGYADLSAEEIRSIVAFIRAWESKR